MTKHLLFTLLFLTLAPSGYAQDSTVPASVRAMIEASQAGTRHEETARVQIGMLYSDFLTSLAGDPQKQRRVEAMLVSIFKKRSELSEQVTRGQASTSDLDAISGYAYLRTQVAPLLNTAELSILDARGGGPSDAQLKQDYAAELARSAGGLTQANQELVLDTLVKHLRMGAFENSELGKQSVENLISRQSAIFLHAGEEMRTLFTGDQLQQVEMFLNRLQMNLYMNASMPSSAQ